MKFNRTILALLVVCVGIAVLVLQSRPPAITENSHESANRREPQSNSGSAPLLRIPAPTLKPPPASESSAGNKTGIAEFDAKADRTRRQENINRGLEEWRTPIEFYGKIVDEKETPIPDAEVKFGCTDLSPDGHSTYQTKSDSLGLFSLRGVNGKFLSVQVSKPGYYAYKSNPYGFTYAGENLNFSPDGFHPIIFRLRKKGRGEPMVTFNKTFRIPKDGSPVNIDLINGATVSKGQGHIQIECRTQAPEQRGAKYDWKCRLTVLAGGIQPNTDEFGFFAPIDGYRDSDEIDMTVASAIRWQSDVTRTYFVRTANGYYGRLTFRMVVSGDHFCRIESALNPTGSQNLEQDESGQPVKSTNPE